MYAYLLQRLQVIFKSGYDEVQGPSLSQTHAFASAVAC